MNKTLIAASLLASLATAAEAQERPNVIIIFSDDQGFNDLGCFGSEKIKTPAIDKMASEGLKLTNFYVSASVSSASRAGLLTGKLNIHNGVTGVYFPDATGGLPPKEITIAESLKEVGYKTACFGKWHLGDSEDYLPINQGFDEYYGIPYSNDMYIGSKMEFADEVNFREGYTLERAKEDQAFVAKCKSNEERKRVLKYASPLYDGNKIVEYPCDQATTTERYIDHAINFIDESKDEPFFLYITPAMPHIPLYASEKFKGKSEGGLYGDAVEEIDWNVGRLLDHIEEQGLAENTLIIFASDNGPWLGQGKNAGCAKPFRDGKFSSYDGGVRVPCIIRWSGKIPAGVTSDAIATSIDFFPSIMKYASCPINHKIDGMDVTEFWEDPTNEIRDEYIYIKNGQVMGVRKNEWIYLPKTGARNTPKDPTPELFNIVEDPAQSNNRHSSESKVVSKLEKIYKSVK